MTYPFVFHFHGPEAEKAIHNGYVPNNVIVTSAVTLMVACHII